MYKAQLAWINHFTQVSISNVCLIKNDIVIATTISCRNRPTQVNNHSELVILVTRLVINQSGTSIRSVPDFLTYPCYILRSWSLDQHQPGGMGKTGTRTVQQRNQLKTVVFHHIEST
eukprot:sb/3476568/